MCRVSVKSMEGVGGNRGLQYLATLAANMGSFAVGSALSYPAVALPSMRKDLHIGPSMTDSDESWIGSIFALGVVASGPIAGYTVQQLGRRKTILVLSMPFLVSWMIINFATSVVMILVGRFLKGFFSGIFLVAAPIFTAEIADASIRGAVCCTFDMSSSAGILFMYILGWGFKWRVQAMVSTVGPLLVFFLTYLVPESPTYLLKTGRIEEAKIALAKYKGHSDNPELILTAFEDLQKEVIESHAQDNPRIRDLLAKYILIPVSIAFMIFLFQVLSGIDPVLVQLVDIFNDAGSADKDGWLNEYSSAVIFGVIQLAAGVVGAFFVDKTGRRFLLLLSEAVMAVSLAALGLFFYLRSGFAGRPARNQQMTTTSPIHSDSSISWLPLTSLSTFILAYSVGIGPVGYLLMGEILPLRVKGLAGCLITSTKWMLSFLVTQFFDDFIQIFGEAGVFWLFSICCSIGFIYIFVFVPETNGKSLVDIQRVFRAASSETISVVEAFSVPKLGLEPTGSQNAILNSGTEAVVDDSKKAESEETIAVAN